MAKKENINFVQLSSSVSFADPAAQDRHTDPVQERFNEGPLKLGADDQTSAEISGSRKEGHSLVSGETTEEQWKEEYAKSAALQDEFGTEAHYLAYRKAEKAGRIRRVGGIVSHAESAAISGSRKEGHSLVSGEVHTRKLSEVEMCNEFAASKALQDEFGTEAHYLAYMKAEKAGRIKFVRRGVSHAGSASAGMKF